MAGARIAVVIPALNEPASIGKVIDDLPRHFVNPIVVADNNSTDRTADVARGRGAIVVPARRQGYGSACLAGLAFLGFEIRRLSLGDNEAWFWIFVAGLIVLLGMVGVLQRNPPEQDSGL